MKDFLQKQFNKEKAATSRIWRFFLKVLVIYWGIIGIGMLFSSLWSLGLVFIGAAVYILYQTNHTKNNVMATAATIDNQEKTKNIPQDIIYCTKCGTKHQNDAKFCSSCGSSL